MGKNIKIGLLLGGFMGGAYSAWATVLRATRGNAAFERVGTTYPAMVATYLVAFAIGGVLIGLLWNVRRRRAGAALLGFLGVFPVYLGTMLIRVPANEWLPARLTIATLASLVAGGGVGLVAWYDHYGTGGRHP